MNDGNKSSKLTEEQLSLFEALEQFKNISSVQPDISGLREQISTIGIETKVPFSELDLSPIFDYHIFPQKIMIPLCQWHVEKRLMQIGDTIVQKVYFPKKGFLAVRMIFGVRINEIIDEPDRKGFSYVTLPGHAENGISTFTLEKVAETVIFKIHTFSLPGNFVSRILAVITNKFQYRSTQEALRFVKYQLEKQ